MRRSNGFADDRRRQEYQAFLGMEKKWKVAIPGNDTVVYDKASREMAALEQPQSLRPGSKEVMNVTPHKMQS